MLLHDSGETIESYTKIVCKAQNDPQALGSAITYARRYGLQSLVCIGAEDDDAEKSMARNKPNIDALVENDFTVMNNCSTLKELGELWASNNLKAKTDKRVINEKERLKTVLK